MSKPANRLIDKYVAIQKIGLDVEVPWEVSHVLGAAKKIMVLGDSVCLGVDTDFCSLAEARAALEWYAQQLGGQITWERLK